MHHLKDTRACSYATAFKPAVLIPGMNHKLRAASTAAPERPHTDRGSGPSSPSNGEPSETTYQKPVQLLR